MLQLECYYNIHVLQYLYTGQIYFDIIKKFIQNIFCSRLENFSLNSNLRVIL